MTPPTHLRDCSCAFVANIWVFDIIITERLSDLVGGVTTQPYEECYLCLN